MIIAQILILEMSAETNVIWIDYIKIQSPKFLSTAVLCKVYPLAVYSHFVVNYR